jgi:uncharacterized protein
MFQLIVATLILMSVWWWRRIDRRLNHLGFGLGWRLLLAGYCAAMVVFPLVAVRRGHYLPAAVTTPGFLWYVLVMPLVVVVTAGGEVFGAGVRVGRRRKNAKTQAEASGRGEILAGAVGSNSVSRRRFLTAAAAIAPPIVTGGLTGVGLAELGQFRVRSLDVAVHGWPRELDGFAIAMVADVHHGPFSTQRMLDNIVVATNTIHNGGPADLVVLVGDLINTTLDDLPSALDMVRQLRGRLGVHAILGNHDVMDDEDVFAAEMERAGIPLLRDQVATIEAGPDVKIQLLGVTWRIGGDEPLFESVAATAAQRDPRLFPICVVHHPHGWDEAVRQGLPLVLSGHTHGGQIMLTDRIGLGPLRFRYWNGVHRRENSTLVICNGVGNWFPLRFNAPAEILKLTLSRTAEGGEGRRMKDEG